MSARFWLFSCACAGGALTGGFGLGLYATTQPRPGTETSLPQAVSPDGTGYDMGSADLTGPAIVRCDGCGPTLADRQMAADMAGWDGMNDPAVRDYAAQGDEMTPDHAEPPQTVRTLPASIERFANGESEGSFQPVRIAQAPESRTSAEEAPADAALSY
ncbi:hypothetical protein [Sphingobium fuliginis]|uniref:Uncharacterized protein n=1 Tax=Sphingobium fuliginis ATCC 27551 TaxID=1208342 RepID=A0A5B8CIR5_SPHSA|nr:hypothetical protein [Sphingobium fuliginis]QDC38652.1 hypothetical protein FIL70_16785 [Sphingobium fuliginis ATCC 27551]